MKQKLIATLALVLTTTSLTFATGSVSIPHIFSSGQAAKASDVNENFQALADAMNAATARLDPFSRPDDFSTIKLAGLVDGAEYFVGGINIIIKKRKVTSFKEGDSSEYEILTPYIKNDVGGAWASDIFRLASSSVAPARWGAFSNKTTVDGHPAAIIFFIQPGRGSAGDACEADVIVNIDQGAVILSHYLESGYMNWMDGGWSEGELGTKSGQQKCKALWRQLMQYVSITKVS